LVINNGSERTLDEDLGKNLELDFLYTFVSTDLDLQTKFGILTKPNFMNLS